MKLITKILLLLVCTLIIACSDNSTDTHAPMGQAYTYEGTIPCANCDGIKIKLDIVYYLDKYRGYTQTMEYLGEKGSSVTIKSSWTQKDEIITLNDNEGNPKEKWQFIFEKANNGNSFITGLVKLDENGQPLSNYTLKRTRTLMGL